MTRAALLVALLLALLSAFHAAAAQSPLERRVTVHLRDAPLRDAIDRVAVLAGIRISYSGDHLPLDRRASLVRDSASVGELLSELLSDVAVQPVVVSGDHVVLAPRASSSPRAPPVLERVVVTGSVAGAPERELSMALDVVPGRAAERRHESSLSALLDAAVPGMWLWTQAPSSMVARYGSIRGASSFGVSYPKVYIDGIEVANPLLLTRVEPAQVERVEVIRGPQGAALYGADAISGVVNIISRHENAADGRHAVAHSRMGWTASDYAPATPVQEHALALRAGTNLRSLGVAGGLSTTGRYIPNAYSREGRIAGDARLVRANSVLSMTARFQGKQAGVPVSPLLPSLNRHRTSDDADPQSLNLYSAGATYRRMPSGRLMLAVTAGVDGYRLDNISIESTPVPSSADSALRAATGRADRATIRASVVRGGILSGADTSRPVRATLTLAAEQSVLHGRTEPPRGAAGLSSVAATNGRWSHNSGLSAQVNVAFAEAAYLTAGNRLERISSAGDVDWESLPMLGASFVRDIGGVTVKARSSFGRAVRAVTPIVFLRDPKRLRPNDALEPEEQTGVDVGADIYLGRWGSLHVTRFDQEAVGLIQLVTLFDSTNAGNRQPKIHFQRQNVGEITNRGWEGKLTLRLGDLDFVTTGSMVDSRVRRVAPRYQGDLRAGDRMLGVPERTGSATAAWIRSRWSTSFTVSRAANWIDYDRLAIARRIQDSGARGVDIGGAKLRQFWMRYPGATRARGSFDVKLPRDLDFSLAGENLTGEQRGEPDTMTILPGRTVTAGIRARF